MMQPCLPLALSPFNSPHLLRHELPHLVGGGVDDLVVEQARSGQEVSGLDHAHLPDQSGGLCHKT